MKRRRQIIWQRLLAVGLVLLPYLVTPGHAASPYEAIQQGTALYQAGRYEAAAQQYATAAQAFPEAAEIHFNQGNALYKQGNYAHALEHYQRALSTDNRILASRVKYNLGNVQYQQALEAMRASQDAATPLRAAMLSYRESLQLEPHYQEARYNLELAHLLLRQLQLQAGQEQQTDQHQNQPLAQQTPLPGATLQAPQPETSQASQAQPDGQAQEHAALDNADSPATPTEKLPELRPEEAQRLLEAIRQRARQADEHRQQWRGASDMRRRVDKDW